LNYTRYLGDDKILIASEIAVKLNVLAVLENKVAYQIRVQLDGSVTDQECIHGSGFIQRAHIARYDGNRKVDNWAYFNDFLIVFNLILIHILIIVIILILIMIAYFFSFFDTEFAMCNVFQALDKGRFVFRRCRRFCTFYFFELLT